MSRRFNLGLDRFGFGSARAAADIKDNRVTGGRSVLLAKGDTNPPAAPPTPEVDPLAEFKKSNAYRVLLETGRIDKDCKILNPYFRVEVVEGGHVVFNVVYKLRGIINFRHTHNATITYWNGQTDAQSNRGQNNGSLWDWTVKRATETEYIQNAQEVRNQGNYGGP